MSFTWNKSRQTKPRNTVAKKNPPHILEITLLLLVLPFAFISYSQLNRIDFFGATRRKKWKLNGRLEDVFLCKCKCGTEETKQANHTKKYYKSVNSNAQQINEILSKYPSIKCTWVAGTIFICIRITKT